MEEETIVNEYWQPSGPIGLVWRINLFGTWGVLQTYMYMQITDAC